MIEIPETHQQGLITLHNSELIEHADLQNADLGIQTSYDGRVWVCINGLAFLRFKPFTRGRYNRVNIEEVSTLMAEATIPGNPWDVRFIRPAIGQAVDALYAAGYEIRKVQQ